MAHRYSLKYSIIEFSVAKETFRGAPTEQKMGLNGVLYIKRFFCIRYTVEGLQLTAYVMVLRRHCSKRRRTSLVRMVGGSVGGIMLKLHHGKI